jgi:hypothetical protein
MSAHARSHVVEPDWQTVAKTLSGVFSWEVKSFWVSHRMFHGMSKGVFGY